MIIERVEAIPYRIPMRKPLHFASGAVHHMDNVLVRLTTDTGIVGVADIPPRPYTYGETQAGVVSLLEGLFADALLGADPLDRGRIHARLNCTVGNFATRGGVDIALWDIIGISLGTPVHRLLGGFADAVRVSHMLGFAPADEMVEEALRYRDVYGITAFKIKVGRYPLSLDIDLCRALRSALGPEAELYMDANRGWTAADAVRVLEQTEDLSLTFFEEPNDAKEVLGRRRLVQLARVPIIADESAPSLGDAAREVQTGGATALSIKTARTGFTESQKILAYAEALGIDVIMGNQVDTQIGSTATVAFGAAFAHSSRHPAELSNFLDMADDLAADAIEITDGAVLAPRIPGVGVRIDPEKLAHYRVDGKLD